MVIVEADSGDEELNADALRAQVEEMKRVRKRLQQQLAEATEQIKITKDDSSAGASPAASA